jgi:pimeloyl-ACP methyl ester carboxylesterase
MMTGCSSETENVDFAMEKHLGAKNRPAIIFVHSDAGDKEQFASAFEHVRTAGWSVASFDRRGHGKSSMPKDGRFGYAVESDDIFTVADKTGFERIVIVGHSGGGDVAFKAANERPQRIAGLLLVDPAPDPAVIPEEQTAQTLAGLRKDFKGTMGSYYRSMAGPNRAIADEIVTAAQATPAATVIGINEHQKEFKPRDYAGKFAGPAHAVIQPEFDIEGALHRIQPGMTYEAIGGAGHWIHMVAPVKFEAALDRFLAQVT